MICFLKPWHPPVGGVQQFFELFLRIRNKNKIIICIKNYLAPAVQVQLNIREQYLISYNRKPLI